MGVESESQVTRQMMRMQEHLTSTVNFTALFGTGNTNSKNPRDNFQ